jgi:hypothetical protein
LAAASIALHLVARVEFARVFFANEQFFDGFWPHGFQFGATLSGSAIVGMWIGHGSGRIAFRVAMAVVLGYLFWRVMVFLIDYRVGIAPFGDYRFAPLVLTADVRCCGLAAGLTLLGKLVNVGIKRLQQSSPKSMLACLNKLKFTLSDLLLAVLITGVAIVWRQDFLKVISGDSTGESQVLRDWSWCMAIQSSLVACVAFWCTNQRRPRLLLATVLTSLAVTVLLPVAFHFRVDAFTDWYFAFCFRAGFGCLLGTLATTWPIRVNGCAMEHRGEALDALRGNATK